MWTQAEIKKHLEAAKLLEKTKDKAFAYIANTPRVSERDVTEYIDVLYKEHRMSLHVGKGEESSIVGFNAHAAAPHYFAPKRGSAVLKPNSLILIDIWARLRDGHSPFGDITWMGFAGSKIPKEILKAYKTVIDSRDEALEYIEKNLAKGIFPIGRAVDEVSKNVIRKAGYGKYILHSTGHSIGFVSPHGNYGHLRPSNFRPIVPDLGYTIEPGIYINGRFGIRSEIDFYIDKKRKLHVTTKMQKELVRI